MHKDKIIKCSQCGKVIKNKLTRRINGESRILCPKHYAQYVKFGKFLDSSQRSIYDPNDFIHAPEGVWVVCFNRRHKESGRFLIDEADLDLIAVYKWRYWKGRFFTGNKQPVGIHQFLMNPPENAVVDHINGDPADNRRCNLRIVTQAENCINKAVQRNSQSGIAGVPWDRARNRWAPEISIGRRRKHLGRYKTLAEAIHARYTAEKILFGEYRSDRNDLRILKETAALSDKEKAEIEKKVKLKLVNFRTSETATKPVGTAPQH